MYRTVLAGQIATEAKRLAEIRRTITGKVLTPGCMGENHVQVAIFGNPEEVTHIHLVQGSSLPKSLMESFGPPMLHIVPRAFAASVILN